MEESSICILPYCWSTYFCLFYVMKTSGKSHEKIMEFVFKFYVDILSMSKEHVKSSVWILLLIRIYYESYWQRESHLFLKPIFQWCTFNRGFSDAHSNISVMHIQQRFQWCTFKYFSDAHSTEVQLQFTQYKWKLQPRTMSEILQGIKKHKTRNAFFLLLFLFFIHRSEEISSSWKSFCTECD